MKTGLVFNLLIFIVLCSNECKNTALNKMQNSSEIVFFSIHKGVLLSCNDSLFERLIPLNRIQNIANEVPDIMQYKDSKNIYCIITKAFPTFGYSAHTDSISITGNILSVYVHIQEPHPKDRVEEAETIPYEIIKIADSIPIIQIDSSRIYIINTFTKSINP
jgi:hypothetical protein